MISNARNISKFEPKRKKEEEVRIKLPISLYQEDILRRELFMVLDNYNDSGNDEECIEEIINLIKRYVLGM